MHILLVCQYFPPESNAPAIRTYEHARRWVQLGHRVTVLTGLPHHPHGVVPSEYRHAWRRRETVDGVEVVRTWLYATANRGVVRRSASYASFLCSATIAGRLR
ncbi:MAG: glycosyltransferase family 4 protein, partial [Longimicrobiales bacterium]